MSWERDHAWEQATQQVMRERGMTDETAMPKAFNSGPLRALVAREPIGVQQEPRWHPSVSRTDRLPSWEEVARVAHELRPGVPMVIGIPPRSWWINVHPYVLHLFELCDEVLIDQWQFEARGDRPT